MGLKYRLILQGRLCGLGVSLYQSKVALQMCENPIILVDWRTPSLKNGERLSSSFVDLKHLNSPLFSTIFPSVSYFEDAHFALVKSTVLRTGRLVKLSIV